MTDARGRLLALQAIMDGRGLDRMLLGAPAAIRRFGGAEPSPGAVLVVTAQGARLVGQGTGPLAPPLRPEGLGHDGQAGEMPPGALDVSADIARMGARIGAGPDEKGPSPRGRRA